jgi:CheY-like chemotaxis protein
MLEDKKTILIVEDEEELREMYTLGLSNDGYTVLQAANGVEALQQLEKEHVAIDMILLDIIMPVLDGFATLEKIKQDERFQKKPVIFLTNLDNSGDRQQALEMGADDFFVKSRHTPSELVGKIRLFFFKDKALLIKKII